MKKIFIIMSIAIFLLSGCRKSNTEIGSAAESTKQIQSEQTVTSSLETELAAEPVENNSRTPVKSESTESSVSTESKATASRTESSKVPDLVPQVPGQNQQTISTVTESKATAEGTAVIADKVIEYLNNLRAEQGISPAKKLIGLTEYAKYRSQQLVTNFAHDTNDERAAAAALRYGRYINPSEYGTDGEPFYSSGSREAIAYGGYIGTADYVARSLAQQVRDSSKHWAYVGSAEYPYIAVGITFDSGMWYCDIAMSKTDEYEK